MYISTELHSTVCLYSWLLWKQLETRVMILISVHILRQEMEFCFWWLKQKKTKHRFSKNIFYRLLNQMIWQIQKIALYQIHAAIWTKNQEVWITQYPFMAFIKNYMTNSLIIQEFPLNKRWLARDCITSQKKKKAAVTYLLLSPKPPYSSSLVHTGDKLHLKKTL